MINLVGFLVAVALCAVSGVHADGTEKIRVACVGDSITFGFGIPDPNDNSYPAQLGKLLGKGWDVRNFGQTGLTLLKKGGAPYWNLSQYKAALAFNPDIVIIKLGTNDTKPDNWKHKDDYVTDYVDMIESFRKLPSRPKVFACYPVPVYPERWGIKDEIVREEVIPLIDKVSAKTGVKVIDLYKALSDRPDLFPDKVHPNAAGAEIIAKVVADEIRPKVPTISGYDYKLPSFEKGSRFLFQGDSITDMGRQRSQHQPGYKNHYLGHSHAFILAGRLGHSFPYAGFEFVNRGISGNKLGDLKKRWEADALDVKPDVLTILVGINNVITGKGLDTFESDYRELLNASRRANPNLRIVLIDPFVQKIGFPDHEVRWPIYRAEVDKMLVTVAKLAKEFDAVHIKMQGLFDEAAEAAPKGHWLWDGIHPSPQGYELIARHWLKAVSERWPNE
ncbi:MAG: GDSL-type esterase/lipase family protein [Opitutales bacterium]